MQQNRHARAAALFPRNLARLVQTATYDASPVPSPDYERAMAARRLRAINLTLHLVDAPAPAGAPLLGSRYTGGSSALPRSARA